MSLNAITVLVVGVLALLLGVAWALRRLADWMERRNCP